MDRNLLRNIASLLTVQGGNYLLPLLTVPYLVRTLQVDGYGRLGFSFAVVQYFILLTDYGFNLSATRAVATQRSDPILVSRLFWNVQACKAALALVGFCLLVVVSQLVPAMKNVQDVLFAAYLAVLGNLLFPVWLFQGMETMGRIAWCSLIAKTLVIPTTFWLVNSPDDAWLAAAIQGVASVIAGLIAVAIIWRERIIRWVAPSYGEVRRHFAEGWHLFLSSAAVGLYTASSVVILGLVAGNSAVGIFAAADKIRQAVQGLMTPVSQAVYPRINALMHQDRTKALGLIRQLFIWQGSVSFLLAAMLFILAPVIVRLAYGEGSQEISDLLRWLAPLLAIVGVNNVFGVQTMLPLGMTSAFSRILIVSGLLNVALIIPLCYFFAAVGAAASMLITELLVTLLMAWILYSRNIHVLRKAAA